MMNLLDFVRESNRIEGIMRDPLPREIDAHQKFLLLSAIWVSDLEKFVETIQPGARLRERAGMDVRVGGHVPPRGGHEIPERLEALLQGAKKNGPYATHIAYEELHPFIDGNGRSGRVLWLWMMREAPLGFLHKFYYQTLDAQK